MNLFCVFPTVLKHNGWVWGVFISYAQHLSSLQWRDWCSHLNTVPHKRGGKNPQFPLLKHFNIYVPAHYISSLYDGAEREHMVAHEQVNWDSISISVLPSMDSAGFPVALSWPQCLRFLQCMTYFTLITQYWSVSTKQTAVCLQHMSDLYIIWFKEKCFLECLCMNLNFKLFLFFLFFIKSTDLFWEKSYVNIWFISYPGNKRFMCGYSIKSNVFWLKRCIEAHPPRSEYLLYECIILPFWTRSNVHLHDSLIFFF